MTTNFVKIALLLSLPFYFWVGHDFEIVKSDIQPKIKDSNLIRNSNFFVNAKRKRGSVWEDIKMPQINGWVGDGQIVKGGANDFVLYINTDHPKEYYYVTKISGTNNYTLSAWWKKRNIELVDDTTWKRGSINVGVLKNKILTQIKTITIKYNDTVWAEHALNFSLNTQTTDTIAIMIDAGTRPFCEVCIVGGYGYYFDSIKLIWHN